MRTRTRTRTKHKRYKHKHTRRHYKGGQIQDQATIQLRVGNKYIRADKQFGSQTPDIVLTDKADATTFMYSQSAQELHPIDEYTQEPMKDVRLVAYFNQHNKLSELSVDRVKMHSNYPSWMKWNFTMSHQSHELMINNVPVILSALTHPFARGKTAVIVE